ncbi:HNH endonuclease [uncultured Gimesia sp.]|uniref:HNH endonuclease n=1 Tax=uncultured Gimesia sp. TaxID=1678688 RepID=UPI0030D7E154|tara:strand:- start:2311 stop:3549 length:1239 start_codon:yes stop_codon:yes gene_type:complete
MSEITRKIAIFGCLMLTGFCFWKAAPGLVGGADASMLPSAQAALSPGVTPPRVVTTPIQEMRPGMRVVGRNPLRLETESTIDPTPEGWRLISVRMLKQDGSYFEAQLLRPLSWISQHRAKPGVTIQLNMPELHVVGAAEVLSISDCPPIDPGDGPVVLSTFKNTANNVLNIYVEGETEPIGVTAGHPIWSEDRQAFVHSEKLSVGEKLRSALGRTVRITSIEPRAGPKAVYNLEVAGEHVYSVTNSGLLVHNMTPCDLVTEIGLPDGRVIDLNASGGGLPTGVTRNSRGGVDFSNSPDLYPVQSGQRNIVKIQYTGSRRHDFAMANEAAGFGTSQKPPKLNGTDFTWHHLDDYDPLTNTGTMQLVKRTTHEATYPHPGGVSQFKAASGIEYDQNNSIREALLDSWFESMWFQ